MTIPEDAYQKLAHVFSSRENKVLEIEIISPTLGSPLLEDGTSIGITKKALVQAYTVARHLFAKRLMSMSEDKLGANLETKTQPEGPSDLAITEVMLLFDCEHLTACNWRKRRLRAAVMHCLKTKDQVSSTIQMLETELTLMTTYQCSPLHRHTKSPTLWSHRLWVLRQLILLQRWSPAALIELERKELAGVLRAAELHPKNYYAFGYMRQVHALLANSTTYVKLGPDRRAELGETLVHPVLDWCLAHPRDISGWIFGQYLLSNVSEQQDREDAVGRVLRFARDVGWEGESLWTFVDQALREFDLESVVDDILGLDGKEPTLPREPKEPSVQTRPWQTRLERARAYWTAYGRGTDPQ